ncbi:MAG: hypothetical protein WBJ45_07410 [Limnohabitans sp.]|uniref:hypothetical protein n=1 Tax=Limnohabitans sp. TaxID=1907725 RepID=UPI003BAE650C
MNRYKTARGMGFSHEGAVLFESRNIVDEELKHPREEMSSAEIHTVLANLRSDVSGIAILMSDISKRQRQSRWLIAACLFVLLIIAIKI